MATPTAPFPPADLAARVGPGESSDVFEAYEQEGAAVRDRIELMLPSGWDFDGKRVLDFGCGSGRVLRHFLDEAERAEFWGCDIDGPSIEWIKANLAPPLHCFQNDVEPPIALDDGYLDLVWATSVFTHIDRWSDWLIEMHRVLAPGGILIASFLGEGMWEAVLDEPYREDEIGMAVLGHWRPPGGAWVFHSEWWLREHWGRAFDVLEVARPPRGPLGGPEITHSYISLRKRAGRCTPEQLERCRPDEPREEAGLRTQIRVLRKEIEQLVPTPAPDPAPSPLRQAIGRSPLGSLRRRLRATR